jgi:hypothetical protein
MTEKKKFHDPMAFVRAGNENPTPTPVAIAESIPEKPAQKREKLPEAFPWESAHPKVKEPFVVRMPQALHSKLTWVAERSPESMHSIALEAIRVEVEKRVRELLKAEKEGYCWLRTLRRSSSSYSRQRRHGSTSSAA